MFLLFVGLLSFQIQAAEMDLSGFLNAAWKTSPSRQGEVFSGEAGERFVSAARGKYLPHVTIDAIDSTGFPASNSQLGVSGIVGSPFRAGFAAAVIVEQTIYDFGRIQASLKAARAEKSLDEAHVAKEKLRFLLEAGHVYLRCAHARSSQVFDEMLLKWAQIVARESARLTRTGQRSIVDNSLIETEVDNLHLELDEIIAARASLREQMRLLGVEGDCQELGQARRPHFAEDLRVPEPSQLLARAQVELARSEVEARHSDQLPRLNAMGSAGYMEKSNLVDRKDYAAGVSLSFPIWNGDEDRRREQGAKSRVAFQNEQLRSARLTYQVRFRNMNDQYKTQSRALDQLERNLVRVQKTIDIAAKRYQSLQGTLIDVREAFRQLREMGHQHLRTELNVAALALELGLLKE